MLRNIGLSSLRDFSSASSPHGNQSTGLSACCSKYGELEFDKLLAKIILQIPIQNPLSPPILLRARSQYQKINFPDKHLQNAALQVQA